MAAWVEQSIDSGIEADGALGCWRGRTARFVLRVLVGPPFLDRFILHLIVFLRLSLTFAGCLLRLMLVAELVSCSC